MRLLFIAPYVPSVIRVRPFNFIRELSKRHEITLVCLVQSDSDAIGLDEIGNYCEKVHAIPLGRAKSLISCLRRFLTPVPLQAAYTEWPSIRDHVSEVASSGAFDLIHVEHIRGAHLAMGVEGLPKVYDSVDCITRLLKQFLAVQGSLVRRLLTHEELLKMRSYEPRIAAKFDRVVITSRRDKRALEALMRTRSAYPREHHAGRGGTDCPDKPAQLDVAVVSNGVDSEYFRPMDLPVDENCIAFTGKMSYVANASSVLHFYRKIFPRIRAKCPGSRFKIIGSSPPDCIRKLEDDPAVTVTGYVPDIRPQLGSAAVVVCPLTVGVGIQNKVLEAMAMAKPVVSTSVACSGIPEAVHGHHLIRADNPENFADEVVRLLGHPRRRVRLGENACQLVCTQYSWDGAAQALEQVYAEAADMHKRRLSLAA